MKQLKFFSLVILFSLLQTATFAQSQNASKVVTDYFAWIDAGNIEAVGSLLTDDFVATAPFAPVPFDKMAWRGVGQGFKTAFSGMQHEITDWVASGNKVAVKGMFRGTNTGPNMGNPPTGNKVSLPFNTFFEFDGMGKIKSLVTQFDMKSFEAQLMAGRDPNAAAEAAIRAMLAAADAGDGDKFMSYWAADGVNYFAGKQTSGDDMTKRIMAFSMGFPDIKRHLDEVVVSGNNVTVRGWVTGTNTSQFRGQAPTGNSIKVPWLGFYKLDNAGKVQSGWVEFDTQILESQLMGGSATGK
ncbi:MAG: ester cyclase, partial [Saprospiraceae bacterium]